MFWVVLAGMTGLAALAAVWPLIRGARRSASVPADAAFYKAQLGEIERDVARGFLPADEAAGARVEAARRLIATSAATADGAVADAPGLRRGWAIAIVVAAPVVALALYADLGRPDLPDSPLAQRKVDTRSMSGVEAALAHVEQQLAANPDNGPGWSLVAPVYMKLGRFDDAVEAFKQALRLNGENAAVRADYGEALVGAAGGIVTADARAAFDKALAEQPGLPSARFYLGLAAEQDGDLQKAIAIYRALLGDAPPRAPWTPALQARLAALTGGGAAPAQSDAAPAQSDAAPAQDDAAQQDAMIRGMVDRLATRLATSGGGADEWQRLIRAYTVLHETDKAKDALASARKALAGDAQAEQQLDELARELGIGG
ncbi:MAG: c-type cytochrome biogenesis protein CcmI [Roseiarcus sp.]